MKPVTQSDLNAITELKQRCINEQYYGIAALLRSVEKELKRYIDNSEIEKLYEKLKDGE